MGKMQRRKGHDFERAIARRLRAEFPHIKAKRGWQSRGGGKEEPDVCFPGLHIECKHGKKPSPRAALAQAIDDAASNATPVAVVKDDRQPAFVTLRLEDWLTLLRSWVYDPDRGANEPRTPPPFSQRIVCSRCGAAGSFLVRPEDGAAGLCADCARRDQARGV